jgi:hypothetical protein
MVRGVSIALGIGLVILFIVGLGRHATPWLTWLDGLAALFAFVLAGAGAATVATALGGGGVFALAIGLGVLWIIGLSTHAVVWLTWFTFAFACGFLLLGMVESVGHKPTTTLRTTQPHPV